MKRKYDLVFINPVVLIFYNHNHYVEEWYKDIKRRFTIVCCKEDKKTDCLVIETKEGFVFKFKFLYIGDNKTYREIELMMKNFPSIPFSQIYYEDIFEHTKEYYFIKEYWIKHHQHPLGPVSISTQDLGIKKKNK